MKNTEKNILIAFIVNISFSIIEVVGGILTNSIAIYSDSLHDFGDAISIGISYFLEKKSKRKPDNKYSFGYIRYSVLGGIIATIVLIIGSIFVYIASVKRLIFPGHIKHTEMIIIAIFGVIANMIAAYYTKDGHSTNQKAVNLHMLEDVLGWIIVLIGAVIIKITKISMIDSLLSMGVSIFILLKALKNLKQPLNIFLGKVPEDIDLDKIKNKILENNKIKRIRYFYVWSIDGYNNYATIHIIVEEKDNKIKKQVKEILKQNKIMNITLEIEDINDKEEYCDMKLEINNHCHHHH